MCMVASCSLGQSKELRFVGVAAWAVALALCVGCDTHEGKRMDLSARVSDAELQHVAPRSDPDVLWFGFDPRGTIREDALQYLPLLKYLTQATGLTFDLYLAPSNASMVDLLGTGKVQFAAIGADTYLRARARYGVVPLVRGKNSEGWAAYQSVIVTAPNSGIERIADLRGKRFAFGNVSSTQGHLIPRIVLWEHGMGLDDLGSYVYTGSHHNCATVVAAGQFDAGGMQDTMGQKMAEEGLLRIIHTSRYYPSSGIAANRDVPAETIEKVTRALLAFDPLDMHRDGLYRWDETEMANGFIAARDGDYEDLRVWSR
jgi:phosphonate transport system substrate-binding protein